MKKKVIVAGKIITGFHKAIAIAFVADGCNSAHTVMLFMRCIQALQCNTNTCHVDLGAQNTIRSKRIRFKGQSSKRETRYHKATINVS